ncbi:MAG: hypothetical protein WBR15_00355 [Gammaproteobacteria bacterium]
MLKAIKTLALTSVVLIFTACGSSGGSSPSGITVSPSGTQVLAGATLQMTATAADGSTTFTWQINGTTGGGGSVGTISANGLYTAPNLPPAGGTVTITAIEQSNTALSGSATLSIGYSNASLNGDYVFSLDGLNHGVPWFVIGEFSTDGAGQISNGLQDINNGTTVSTKTAFTGSYSINSDGSGSLSLGTLKFQLVLQAGGPAFLVSVSNGTTIAGSLSPQGPAANNVSTLSGPLVLNVSGQTAGNQGIGVLAALNALTNGSLPSGTEDVSGANPLIRAAVSGTYAFDGSSHGTLHITDSNGTHPYSFYVESGSAFALLSNDKSAPVNGSLSGQQPISYTNSSLNGPFVFLMNGNSLTQGYVQAGQFNPNGQGSLGTVTEDINTPGNIQTDLITTGTYIFDPSANGRGTLTINNQGTGAPQTYVFYMLSPQQAEFMSTQSSIVAGGYIVTQTQGSAFQNSSLSGAYGFTLGAQTSASNLSAAIGTLSLDGNGNLSGQMIQNLNGSPPSTQSLSGTYTLNISVRGTATLTSSGGGSSPFAIYPVSPNEFFLIGTDSASPYFGIATSQY